MNRLITNAQILAATADVLRGSVLCRPLPKPLSRWQRLIRWLKREKPEPLPEWLGAKAGQTIKIRKPVRYVSKTDGSGD